jgi:hypothetical protein
MPRWMLAPIDHRAEIWKTYPVQRIVVEAPDERAARKQVAGTAPSKLAPNPWLDPALTSCEEVSRRSTLDAFKRRGRALSPPHYCAGSAGQNVELSGPACRDRIIDASINCQSRGPKAASCSRTMPSDGYLRQRSDC